MKLPLNAKEYFLVAPGKFEVEEVVIDFVPEGFTVISPLTTAICGSDLHYYRGEKSKKKLKERLPLILLHEGVCVDLSTGKRVVPLGGYSIFTPPEFVGQENIWPDLPYLGATNRGLARTHLLYPKELLVPVLDSVQNEVASLTEPLSIALRAVRDLYIGENDKIAIIGSGGIAYLLALALRFYSKIPKQRITVFGVDETQLKSFGEFAETFACEGGTPAEFKGKFTAIFEAVGGKQIAKTFEMAFELVHPGGRIGILGISDADVSFPANKLVNQGITVRGLTRSTADEYFLAMKLFADPDFRARARRGINETFFSIGSPDKLREAFDYASRPGVPGRVIVLWPRI